MEKLHEIREEMARQCDYDIDLFAEMVRGGQAPLQGPMRIIRGQRLRLPPRDVCHEAPQPAEDPATDDAATGD